MKPDKILGTVDPMTALRSAAKQKVVFGNG